MIKGEYEFGVLVLGGYVALNWLALMVYTRGVAGHYNVYSRAASS